MRFRESGDSIGDSERCGDFWRAGEESGSSVETWRGSILDVAVEITNSYRQLLFNQYSYKNNHLSTLVGKYLMNNH